MIEIRNYRPADAPALRTIFSDTIRRVNVADYSEAEVEAWAAGGRDCAVWQQKMDAIAPFIAEADGEIVGYADLQQDGLIDHFFCHHNYQGKGVGRRLMAHIFIVGQSLGISRYYSMVSITARPFYERFGFNVVKAQTVEIGGQRLRNFYMERVVD